ncbi:hypothetical protein MKW94_024120 [Papaver nudicaule]|uniref:Uncharacterized protein n=1 Tax=Papaver nudicaule TaxID=74823 RepID=A0AA41W310_PAPNU|nr:hypothetical protein [Papaver nudicaule]
MSWYQDPHLFICNANNTASGGFHVYRCTKELSGSIQTSNLKFLGKGLSNRLSLGNYRESDFDALLAYLIDTFICSGFKTWRIVNCQGLTIVWDQTCGGVNCSWSREPVYSPYYNLPGIFTPPVDAEKEALRRRVSELEKQVSDLTSELKPADEEPWKSTYSSVPSNWVPYEDLDVQNFIPRNTTLKIIKAPGALKFVEDNTNVRASRFHGGIQLVAVNLEELTPDKDEARFDPDIWGSYNHEGTSYAARKLFESEM